MIRGTVYLVGAGPGDPELLTVKAHRCLTQADVVVYDRLINPMLLALTPSHCEHIYAGKRKHLHAIRQADIHTLLIRHARQHKRVVRLKGGDPFVFGRGGEEVGALRAAGIEFEVVPGITAANGASAAACLPLTHRDTAQAVTLVTAHKRHGKLDIDWALVTRPGQTVVIYMGYSVLDDLASTLLIYGQPAETQFSIISRATHDDEFVLHTTLGEVRNHPQVDRVCAPALLIMHNTPAGILPSANSEQRQTAQNRLLEVGISSAN